MVHRAEHIAHCCDSAGNTSQGMIGPVREREVVRSEIGAAAGGAGSQNFEGYASTAAIIESHTRKPGGGTAVCGSHRKRSRTCNCDSRIAARRTGSRSRSSRVRCAIALNGDADPMGHGDT